MKNVLEQIPGKIRALSDRLPASLKKFLPAESIVGIDVGLWSLKAVRVVRSDKTFTIDWTYAESPVLTGWQDRLKQSLEEKRLLGARAAFSLADEKVESHDFRLPKLEEKELDTAIGFEVKKTISSPDFVFHDVVTTEGPGGVDVQCVMVAKEIVKGRFDEGKAVGVQPEFLETESSALLASARFLRQGSGLNRLALIDLGHTSFRLIFIHGGRVSFTRSLYFGLNSICQQAVASLDIPGLDLIPYLTELGADSSAADEKKVAVLGALERCVHESLYTLCEEFRRSEFFAKDQKGLEEIEEILLCGGGACMPGTLDYLRQHLSEKRIDVMDPFKGAANLPEGTLRNSGPLWACAVGLALRGSAWGGGQ